MSQTQLRARLDYYPATAQPTDTARECVQLELTFDFDPSDASLRAP